MAALSTRIVAVATALFVVFALMQSASAGAMVASVVALAVASACAVRIAGVVGVSREVTVGARAHAHRESMLGMPAPQHPDTAGRPRTRAPSMVVATT
jgi:hypothetical protein